MRGVTETRFLIYQAGSLIVELNPVHLEAELTVPKNMLSFSSSMTRA